MALSLAPNLELPIEAEESTFRGWAAGIFEGEGTVTIAVRNQDETFRLVCMVVNTDEQIIVPLHDRWGGWKQYRELPGNRRPAWTWTVTGPRAEQFVRDIHPFIRTDRVRAKFVLALRFRADQSTDVVAQRTPGYKPRQREHYLAMRGLNKRGRA